jgi:hypothetical protein
MRAARRVDRTRGAALIDNRPNRSVPRWRTAVGALLVAGLLAAGADVSLASHRMITRSEAPAVVAAINLRHSDLPTLKEQAISTTPQDKRRSAQLAACAGGVPQSAALADVQSSNFVAPGRSGVTLDSDTEILPSAALVAKDLAAIGRPRALSCLVRLFGGALRATIPKADTVTTHASRLPSVVSGGDGAFAIRLTVVVHVKSATTTVNVPLYIDAVGFTYGQAEVSFTALRAIAAPPASLERQLAALLLARAHAAIG